MDFHSVYVAICHSNWLFISNLFLRHAVATRDKSPSLALKKYVKQLLRHRNFWWFTAMNLIQVSKHKKLMENNGELSNSLLSGSFYERVFRHL